MKKKTKVPNSRPIEGWLLPWESVNFSNYRKNKGFDIKALGLITLQQII